MVIHALRDAFVYGFADLAADMPRTAAGFGVLVGGLTISYIVYLLYAYCCLGRRWYAEWYMVDGVQMQRTYPSPWRSARYLFAFFLVGIMVCTSIWFASAMVGFNPWTTAAATLAISVIATYGSASQLSMMSAAFCVHGENAIQIGEYWEFDDGAEMGGIISAINLLHVELMRLDEKSNSIVRIVRPIDQFFNRTRRHIPRFEVTMPELWKENAEIIKLTRQKQHIL